MLSSNVSTSRSTLKPPLGRMMGGWLSKDSSIPSERQRGGGEHHQAAPGPVGSPQPGSGPRGSSIPPLGSQKRPHTPLSALSIPVIPQHRSTEVIPDHYRYLQEPRGGEGLLLLNLFIKTSQGSCGHQVPGDHSSTEHATRGSPCWKAAVLSSSPGCHAATKPTSITAWHWLSTRWSCAGLSAGNSARRAGQLIWARRRQRGASGIASPPAQSIAATARPPLTHLQQLGAGHGQQVGHAGQLGEELLGQLLEAGAAQPLEEQPHAGSQLHPLRPVEAAERGACEAEQCPVSVVLGEKTPPSFSRSPQPLAEGQSCPKAAGKTQINAPS